MTAHATGRLEGRDGADLLAFTRTVGAPIWDVWAMVTEPAGLGHWLGVWSGRPSDGFVMFEFTAEEGDLPPTRIDIATCESPRLLDVAASDDFGTWRLTVKLEELGPANDLSVSTQLTLFHLIDDPSVLENTGPGWDYYLDRLVVHAAGQDVAAISFDQYYPALAGHYAALAKVLA